MLLVADIIKWSQLEVNLIITCANAPALVAIWKRLHEPCHHSHRRGRRHSPTLSIISSLHGKMGLDDDSTTRTSWDNPSYRLAGDFQTTRKGMMETSFSALDPEMDREIDRQLEKSFAGGNYPGGGNIVDGVGGGSNRCEGDRSGSTMTSSRIAGLGHSYDHHRYGFGGGNAKGRSHGKEIVQSTTVAVQIEPAPDLDRPHPHHPPPPATDGRDGLGGYIRRWR